MNERKALALLGFVVLGASPSFIDWQTSPEKRPQMIAFTVAALALIYFGIFTT